MVPKPISEQGVDVMPQSGVSVKKRWALGRKLVIALAVAVSAVPAWQVRAEESAGQAAVAAGLDRTAQEVYELITHYHVSGVSKETLKPASIPDMVGSLHDPYSQFMTAEQWTAFENGLERSYAGIGILLGKDERGVFVDKVYPGTPAEAAGIRPDDLLSAVNGTDVSGKDPDWIAGSMRGEENTKVSLTIRRGTERLLLTLSRKKISLPVLEGTKLEGGVGYLKLYTFASDGDEQFEAKMKEWKDSGGLHGLVVDLRDNPGGLLDTARRIAKQFIRDGILIHTRDRDLQDDPVLIKGGSTVSFPVIVLVNENSASASEVLAGALQDYGAAQIAGTTTFGKGSVQNIFSLSDGAKLKLTIQEYMTPKGHPVNHVGITPDMPVEGDLTQLLTALRKAGVPNFKVTKDGSSVKINGMSTTDRVPLLEERGRLYVHSRVLAALIGADVKWNKETNSAEFTETGTGREAVFAAGEDSVIFRGGLLYVDPNDFARAFPSFSFGGNASKLELSGKKGS